MLGVRRPTRRTDLRELADEELMQLVRDGEARAFEVVFDRHGGACFSLAYRMCGRRAMAEDVVQEAFLSLWRSGARYDRRDVGEEGIAERLAAPDSTEAEVVRRDEAQTVRDALAVLPAEQRAVIELAYFGGFTHVQIAEMLELPMGTVKGRMRLGLTKMRMSLGDPAEVTA
jgi:RNA polymerase sigma-70 factor (ECF subfamily)